MRRPLCLSIGALIWLTAIGSVAASGRELATAQTAQAPTFNHDIADILFSNCTSCHRPGEVAPFALLTYDDAAKHAKQIARVTARREMPPWKAEHGDVAFANERRLTDRQIALIQQWADAGAPEGDPKDRKAPPVFAEGWLAGQPDATFSPAADYELPAEGHDHYRCFIVPLDLQTPTYVSGLEFRPGNRRVVHHALVFLDTAGQARKVAKGGTDYSCFGGPGIREARLIGGWAPGALPPPRRPEFATPLPAGSDLIVQVHYHLSGKPERDRFALGLTFSGPPSRGRSTVMLFNPRIDIPAGDSHYVIRGAMTLPRDVELLGLAPHAHYLGKEMTVIARPPSGPAITLLRILDWDFNWQGGYQLARPLPLPKGTRLEFEYVYDNSAGNTRNPAKPPVRVKWGEQTTDEMALAFLAIALPTPADVAPFENEIEDEYMAMLFAAGTRLEHLPADLTPEERQGLTLAFALFDRDKDGALSEEESLALRKFLKQRRK
jgi:hypothetical protein